MIVFRGVFHRVEKAAYVLLGLLSVSLIGVAIWAGPNPISVARGAFLFAIPAQEGPYGVLLLVTSLIGAVGGSIANLLYPYFIEQKGWKGPAYRRLQLYDLAFGTVVVIILNLSVWTVGAEILHTQKFMVQELGDLTRLLTAALGTLGGPIFYLGAFAALFSTMVGNATGYGYMLSDISKMTRNVDDSNSAHDTKIYVAVAVWCLFSPLIWCLPGMPTFVTLTIVINAATVVVLPLLAASLWYITAQSSCIGRKYQNQRWENMLMAGLLVLACWSAWTALNAVSLAVLGESS